ncbi:uncharacterized protein LOC123526910 [Mercenaria mercenaria]|uniref:uncharacterized protein LOC123526910 n=1 Tax=Mercenaria mercenaria TaxID=6596 RepID=UPI00234E685B|nr:uncharacterized protein LOC123526910 [Mercenaria mercenaria]
MSGRDSPPSRSTVVTMLDDTETSKVSNGGSITDCSSEPNPQKIDLENKKTGSTQETKRVLIVGAGAAGTAAAYSLGKNPDKFEVEIWERGSVPGGVAATASLEKQRGTFVNYGVQGGTPTYRNTLNILQENNLETHPVHMMISFGKEKTAWTNYADSDLTQRLSKDIGKFEKTLKLIHRFEPIFIFLPIAKVLKWFGYSEEFMNEMVFPLTALFFGTGNQTPNVSSAIMARVFLDDDLRLFDYDTKRLLSQTPEMFAFPNLEKMYETIISSSGAKFFRNRPVESVKRTRGKVYVRDKEGKTEVFDEIIFACDAETALKLLEDPSYMERKTLGNVKYFNDLIITHEDEEYMNDHYELHKDTDQYLVRTDPEDPSKIEMSFDLSNYQPQLKKIRDQKGHVFQTIYLDDECSDMWTLNKVNPEKIMLKHWWRQFSHTWRHFAFTVPLMRYIQGKRHTYYCGSYTLVNTHEVAVMSGFSAAYRIGSPYPFDHDSLAKKQFDHYLMVIHGRPRKTGCNCSTIKSFFLAILMAIFAFLSLMIGACVNRKREDVRPG